MHRDWHGSLSKQMNVLMFVIDCVCNVFGMFAVFKILSGVRDCADEM